MKSYPVKDLMVPLSEYATVPEAATLLEAVNALENPSLDEAIHRLIIGQHHSLLVTADRDAREIVGVLRLTDVFAFVSKAMHACTLK